MENITTVHDPEAICRICFLGDGAEEVESGTSPTTKCNAKATRLVSPCRCEGSQKYVHMGCLRKWQRTVQIGGPNHPEELTNENRHLICNVCKSAFTLAPQDRLTLMAEFAGVEAEEVTPGLMLIARNTSSQARGWENGRLSLALRAFLESKAAHFREAVYIVTEVRSTTNRVDGTDIAIGVNLSRTLEAVPDVSFLKGAVPQSKLEWYAEQGLSVMWMNGGPVDPRVVTGMCMLDQLSHAQRCDFRARHTDVRELRMISLPEEKEANGPNGEICDKKDGEALVLCGSMGHIMEIASDALKLRRAPNGCSPSKASRSFVLAWAGYAQWNRGQLIGEMARGSWGWCLCHPLDISHAMKFAMQSSWGKGGQANQAANENECEQNAAIKEPIWNDLRPSMRLSWAPENEVSREFETRFPTVGAHNPGHSEDTQANEHAQALARQFETSIRGNPHRAPGGLGFFAAIHAAHSDADLRRSFETAFQLNTSFSPTMGHRRSAPATLNYAAGLETRAIGAGVATSGIDRERSTPPRCLSCAVQ